MRQEDQVIISFGYTEYVMPMKAGLAIFNALGGADVYIREDRYEKVGNDHQTVYYIKPMDPDKAPKLQHIGPAQFHIGLENQRVKDEQDAAKEAAKAANAPTT
jgi:hypothetical protein